MAGVDQVLSAIVQQGANELRLGSDQAPVVLAMGANRRFTMSPTPDSVLRQLLGEILTTERVAELAHQRRSTFDYVVADVGRFNVVIASRSGGGMDVTFLLAGTAKRSHAVPREPSNLTAHQSNANRELPSEEPIAPLPPRVDEAIRCTAALLNVVEQAVMARATDIHLANDQAPYFRIDGRLRRVTDLPPLQLSQYFDVDSQGIARIMAGHAVEFALALAAERRIRVSLYRMDVGLSAAIRLLPNRAPQLNELNLPLALQDLAELPHGLVLFCGATGSGKSTTMAALCRHAIEQRSVLLITLEDPIEFSLQPSAHSVVRQRQIGRDVASFTLGLRDALRADPDVIMVGELRDAETIRLALTAAETGHLVFASMHSGSAASCLERVVDAYPSEQRSQIRTQLADALRAVVVQKLVPRLRNSGRIPALEVLRVTHGVANVIREGKTAQIGTMLQGGKRDGMISLERCLADYVQSGTISPEQAMVAANNVDSFAMYLSK